MSKTVSARLVDAAIGVCLCPRWHGSNKEILATIKEEYGITMDISTLSAIKTRSRTNNGAYGGIFTLFRYGTYHEKNYFTFLPTGVALDEVIIGKIITGTHKNIDYDETNAMSIKASMLMQAESTSSPTRKEYATKAAWKADELIAAIQRLREAS